MPKNNVNTGLRALTIDEIDAVAGGGDTYVRDEEGRLWRENTNEHGYFETSLVNESSGGYFVSASWSLYFGQAGMSVGTNPFDVYGFGGVGSTFAGPSVNYGWATDTSSYLTGYGVSGVVNGAGAGATVNPDTGAIGENWALVYGSSGFDATYGFSFSQAANGAVDGAQNAADVMSSGFIQQNYPPQMWGGELQQQ